MSRFQQDIFELQLAALAAYGNNVAPGGGTKGCERMTIKELYDFSIDTVGVLLARVVDGEEVNPELLDAVNRTISVTYSALDLKSAILEVYDENERLKKES